ncbi:MAG: DMT family transporter [bacterium]|nr:DMT family transporter [bacterium]
MSSQLKGTIALILSAAIFGSYGIYSRMIGLNFGIFSQSWIRNGITSLILFAPMIIYRNWFKKIQKKDLIWLTLWTLGGSVNMVFFFIASNYLTFGTLYFIAYAFIIVTGFILGSILFKEKMNLMKIVSASLALLGLFLVCSATYKQSPILYLIFAAIVGITASFWSTLSKKISHHYSNFQMTGMDAFISFLVTFILAVLIHEPVPHFQFSISWLGLFLNILAQIAGVGAVVYGYKHLEVQLASIITPVEVAFAAMFGFILFKEILPPLSFFGGLCIFTAAILPHVKSIYDLRSRK